MSFSSIPPELLPYFIGQKEDFSSLQQSIIKISIIFLILVLMTTALRFWVRIRMLRAVGLDDILMMVALLFACLLTTSCLIATHFGLGKHIWNLAANPLDIPKATGQVTKALYGCYLSYSFAIAFVKFSIIATYFRIFAQGMLRKTIMIIGIIVLALLICNIFAIIFTCVPVEAAWKYEIKGKCYPVTKFFYASSAINIATDLALFFLPIPTLWALSMPKPQRIVLCGLFGIGSFTCVASVLRLAELRSTEQAAGIDFSYTTVKGLNWCVIEVGTSIICASLSALRPLATRFLPRLFAFTSNRTAEINTPHSTRGATKLSSLSHSKIPMSRIRVKSRTADDDDERDSSEDLPNGQIYIQQTFKVTNEVWDEREHEHEIENEIDSGSDSVKVLGHQHGSMRGATKIEGNEGSSRKRIQEVFDNDRRSSEEELVQSQGRKATNVILR